MGNNATTSGLLNLSALLIANDYCVRAIILPGFAPSAPDPRGQRQL